MNYFNVVICILFHLAFDLCWRYLDLPNNVNGDVIFYTADDTIDYFIYLDGEPHVFDETRRSFIE